MGFCNFSVADGDVVEASNLNRQNYTQSDIGLNKAIALEKRLLSINPGLNIKAIDSFLDKDSIELVISNHDVIINTIDFDHEAFFLCHSFVKLHNKIEIFPLNLAFGNAVFVSSAKSISFDSFFGEHSLKDSIILYSRQNMKNAELFDKYINKYLDEKDKPSFKDPQLSVGSYLNAAIITTILVKYLETGEIKQFPDSYVFNSEFDI